MRNVMSFAAVALAATVGTACADEARDAVAAPAGTVVARVHAVGAQIYECKSDDQGALAWRFREPIASLLRDGQTVGRHFAGPTWQAADGSTIRGKVVGQAAGETPDDIPWLRLAVVEHAGTGEMAAVSTVQRVATAGGAKTGPCSTEGALLAVPYAADYVFSK